MLLVVSIVSCPALFTLALTPGSFELLISAAIFVGLVLVSDTYFSSSSSLTFFFSMLSS